MEETKKRWEVWLIYADNDPQWEYAKSIEEIKPSKVIIDTYKNAFHYAYRIYGKRFTMHNAKNEIIEIKS